MILNTNLRWQYLTFVKWYFCFAPYLIVSHPSRTTGRVRSLSDCCVPFLYQSNKNAFHGRWNATRARDLLWNSSEINGWLFQILTNYQWINDSNYRIIDTVRVRANVNEKNCETIRNRWNLNVFVPDCTKRHHSLPLSLVHILTHRLMFLQS